MFYADPRQTIIVLDNVNCADPRTATHYFPVLVFWCSNLVVVNRGRNLREKDYNFFSIFITVYKAYPTFVRFPLICMLDVFAIRSWPADPLIGGGGEFISNVLTPSIWWQSTSRPVFTMGVLGATEGRGTGGGGWRETLERGGGGRHERSVTLSSFYNYFHAIAMLITSRGRW